MQSSESVLRKHFAQEAVMRVAMEAGTHSPWVSRLLKRLGHQVLVANPRKIRAISNSESKNDRNDAEQLARFAAFDPKLLSPIEHRSEHIHESQTAQFRAEAFNVFNHAQFNNPNGNWNNTSAFGLVTSANAPRIMQLAVKYQF